MCAGAGRGCQLPSRGPASQGRRHCSAGPPPLWGLRHALSGAQSGASRDAARWQVRRSSPWIPRPLPVPRPGRPRGPEHACAGRPGSRAGEGLRLAPGGEATLGPLAHGPPGLFPLARVPERCVGTCSPPSPALLSGARPVRAPGVEKYQAQPRVWPGGLWRGATEAVGPPEFADVRLPLWAAGDGTASGAVGGPLTTLCCIFTAFLEALTGQGLGLRRGS